MPGSVIQIKTKGKQDIHLTNKPNFNFLTSDYKTYINFVTETIPIRFESEVNFNKKFHIHIPRRGDYLSNIALYFKLPQLIKTSGTYAGWTNNIGSSLIEYIELSINDLLINRIYGEYIDIDNELSVDPISNDNQLIGKYQHNSTLKINALNESEYIVNIPFWFNYKKISNSIPLASVFFTKFYITLKLRDFDKCIVYDGDTPPSNVKIIDSYLLCDYIFVDDILRKKLAKSSHMLLIEQIQRAGPFNIHSTTSSHNHKLPLEFNHPCKELFLIAREIESEENNDWFNYSKRTTILTDKVEPIIKNIKLVLDNQDYNIESHSQFLFTLNNSKKYHTKSTSKYINCIPLSNKPEIWQPTGSLNMSLFDNVHINIETNTNINSSHVYVFALNYNWLDITNGLAKIRYLD
jgi:hypothetical protein